MAKAYKVKREKRIFALVIAIMLICACLFTAVVTLNQCVIRNYSVLANNLSSRELNAQQIRAVGDSSFWANFNCDDISNIAIRQNVLAGSETEVNDKVNKAVINKIENKAKSKFGKSYFLMGVVQFSILENGVRMTDFSNLSSVEMTISISGKVNNAKDSYRAIFVKTNETTENEIINGSFDLLNNLDESAFKYETVSCREEGKTGEATNCLLTIDAHTDGFILLLNVGNPQSDVGLIIMIVGIVLSLVLLIVILQIFRSYKREKLRIATNGKYNANEIKDSPQQATDTDGANENMSEPRVPQAPKAASPKKPTAANVAIPKKPTAAPNTPPKPKLPKK